MKKTGFICVLLLLLFIPLTAFGIPEDDEEESSYVFDIDSLSEYEKEFEAREIDICSSSNVKTYEDYRSINSRSSKQYWFIQENMTVDSQTGLLLDSDGFIGVALGSYFGEIGDRFYITLSTGTVLPVVKVDEKADQHVINGCAHYEDNSVIEFVLDTDIAGSFFGRWGNGYILSGNFNNSDYFAGNITKLETVGERKEEVEVTFEEKESVSFDNEDIFNYGNGY